MDYSSLEDQEDNEDFKALGHDPDRWNARLHSTESSWTGPLRFISKIANSFIGKLISIMAIFTLVLLTVMNAITSLGIHVWFW